MMFKSRPKKFIHNEKLGLGIIEKLTSENLTKRYLLYKNQLLISFFDHANIDFQPNTFHLIVVQYFVKVFATATAFQEFTLSLN